MEVAGMDTVRLGAEYSRGKEVGAGVRWMLP
jgi:hypothetical protein